jgi:23S rRNA pseudouridine2605 synthase
VPPRFAYWTILAGGLPTAFRAAEREDLMPTFQRLREKHPDAEMKWFARGKLWSSPEEATSSRSTDRGIGGAPGYRGGSGFRPRDAERRPPAAAGPRDEPPKKRDEKRPSGAGQDARGRDWRPGGAHRDPRQKYADAKKARNADSRKRRFERKHGDAPAGGGDRSSGPPEGFRGQGRPPEGAWRDRPPSGGKSGASFTGGGAPKRNWRNRPRTEGKSGAPGFRGEQGGPPRTDAWRNRPPHKDSWRDRPRADGKGAPPFSDHRGGAPSLPDRRSAPKAADWRDRPPRKDAWRDRPPSGGNAGSSHDNRRGAPKGDSRGAPRGDSRHRPGLGAKSAPPGFRDGHAPPRKDSWRDRPPGFHGGHGAPPRKDSRRDRPPSSPKGATSSSDRRPPKADWRDRPRTDAPARPPFSGAGKGGGKRPFARGGFGGHDQRQPDEPTAPPRPRSPNREPRPSENPEPSPPPRPSEPAIAPPGPSERGRHKGPRRP